MFQRLKSRFWSLAGAEDIASHLVKSQASGGMALFVRRNTCGNTVTREDSPTGGSVMLVGPDYLMTSQDDVDAIYYFGCTAKKFLGRNAYFANLGAIKQYKIILGRVYVVPQWYR